jgi:tetratricopeptide (TPR) repeat protein
LTWHILRNQKQQGSILAMSASLPQLSANVIEEFAASLRMSRRGETKDALRRVRSAYALARELGDQSIIRQGMNTVAMCQASHGMFIEAVADAVDAYAASRAADDVLQACHAVTTLVGASGLMLGGRAHGETALKLLDQCLASAHKLDNAVLECRVRMLRGIRLGSLGHFDEAEQDFATALSRLGDAPDNLPPAMLALNVAALRIKRAKQFGESMPDLWDAARAQNKEALDMAVAECNPAVESRTCFNIADVHKQLGQQREAIAAFDHALQIAVQWKQRDQIINTQIERGGILLALGDRENALVAFEHAFHEAELHRPTPQAANAATHLADAHEATGDTTQATHWRKIAKRERSAFERESAHTKIMLEKFWASADSALTIKPITNP